MRLLHNAWRKCEENEALPRLKGFVIAGLAAATLFVAAELGFGVVAHL
jgi:hypothetical protein